MILMLILLNQMPLLAKNVITKSYTRVNLINFDASSFSVLLGAKFIPDLLPSEKEFGSIFSISIR